MGLATIQTTYKRLSLPLDLQLLSEELLSLN